MKLTLEQVETFVRDILAETKKKKSKKDVEREVLPSAFKYDDALDFSAALGDLNLYKRQGASNFGPYTSSDSKELNDDRRGADKEKENSQEAMLRSFVHETVEKIVREDQSAWASLNEELLPKNVWEAVNLMYEKMPKKGGKTK